MIALTRPVWRMLGRIFVAPTIFAAPCGSVTLTAEPAFKALAFYSIDVERDHVKTANDAIAFYRDVAVKEYFVFDVTTDWNKLKRGSLLEAKKEGHK
jgi:hypothetical protein